MNSVREFAFNRYGQYLRANGGLPPWRNSITHDIPHRSTTQDWVLWDIDILESRKKKAPPVAEPAYTPLPPPPPPPELLSEPLFPSQDKTHTPLSITSHVIYSAFHCKRFNPLYSLHAK